MFESNLGLLNGKIGFGRDFGGISAFQSSQANDSGLMFLQNLLKDETKDRYTDDFVVEIEGGNFTAIRLAQEYGLDYIEEVFPKHFHFKVRP